MALSVPQIKTLWIWQHVYFLDKAFIYTSPLACVCTNNDYSDYFPLNRGTQQGCPLSQLLFAIAIEPLAVALRSS